MDTRPELYAKMAKITEQHCAKTNKIRKDGRPCTCCHLEYCQMALDWAKEYYGVVLTTTAHPTLPLMGPSGCTAAPHYRPLCSIIDCTLEHATFMDPDYSQKYCDLRNQINEAEFIAQQALKS